MATAMCLARMAGRGCYGRYTLPKVQAIGCLASSNQSAQSRSLAVRYAATGTAGKHWKYEKIVTVSLVALIPAAFIYPNALVDYGLAITIPLHGHWGFESVISDYTHDSLQVVFRTLLYAVSLGTFAGLIYLNYADVGICKAVQMIWALK